MQSVLCFPLLQSTTISLWKAHQGVSQVHRESYQEYLAFLEASGDLRNDFHQRTAVPSRVAHCVKVVADDAPGRDCASPNSCKGT